MYWLRQKIYWENPKGNFETWLPWVSNGDADSRSFNYWCRQRHIYWTSDLSLPKSHFGKIGRADSQGTWFSVDKVGNVRYHSYSTAGFGRS